MVCGMRRGVSPDAGATAAVHAVKGAALALATDVVVHHKNPEQAQEL
ncbi:MAG: hypothetical protein AAF614_22855 [Chloroflexota bacterium]